MLSKITITHWAAHMATQSQFTVMCAKTETAILRNIFSYTLVAIFHVTSRFWKNTCFTHVKDRYFRPLVLSKQFLVNAKCSHVMQCHVQSWIMIRRECDSAGRATAFFLHISHMWQQWTNTRCLRVTGAYANKVFSFSSISWHFLVDFVCNGGRKAFQYALNNKKYKRTCEDAFLPLSSNRRSDFFLYFFR